MGRNKAGSKSERAARNREFQAQLKAEKRRRATRRALEQQAAANRAPSVPIRGSDIQFFGEPKLVRPPSPTRADLEAQTIGPLRDIAKAAGVKVGRMKKADLIDAILTAGDPS